MSALDAQTQRRAFVDVLRPPAGYHLDACFGTTYSLEFEAFTALLLACVGGEVEEPERDPAAVVTTLARLRDRMRVFVSAGRLHAPTTPSRIFARCDRLLKPVSLEGAAFHPKVWVLKFVPMGRPEQKHDRPVYRLLCASRNVTAASHWELGATLEGTKEKQASSFGREVERFCRTVAGTGGTLPAAIDGMLRDLPNVRFDGGRESVEDLRLEWQWPGRRALKAVLPRRAERAILISPFLRSGFVDRLAQAVDDLVVVSTQAELDALPASSYQRLVHHRVFVVTGRGDEDVASLDLHAKLLAWQSGPERETLIGSANGTGAAWGLGALTNCEAMLAMRPGLGVSEIYRAFVSDRKGTTHGWIEPYERVEELPDEEDVARTALDQLRRSLSAEPWVGTYDRKNQALLVRMSPGQHPTPLPDDVDVDLAPLLQQQGATGQPYPGIRSGLRFTGVDLQDLSAFLVVRMRHRRYGLLVPPFCVQLALDLDLDLWDARDEAMNARLLENVDLRALLLAVLLGQPPGTAEVSGRRAGQGSASSVLDRVSIERVLEVCTADPSRTHAVTAVLQARPNDPELAAFREFWANLIAVLRQEGVHV